MTYPPAWELVVNDDKIVVPDDYMLVPKSMFTNTAKAFGYIAKAIEDFGPDPKDRDQHKLIFARVEASDCELFFKEFAEGGGTTGIWTIKERLQLPENPPDTDV